MEQLLGDLKLFLMVAGVISTAAITYWRVDTLSKAREKDKGVIDSLVRWRQRVNTILLTHNIEVPEDDT